MITSAPAEEAAPVADLQEIVVTAQKRQQSLSEVPISLVAATGDQLQTAGVGDVSQLAKVVPGFTAATSFDGLPVFSLRGVGFVANQLSAAPTVSTYVDEAPLPYSAMTAGAMLDLDRVEVLKGPQGTLFGQNSTGGSINLVAAKPTDVFSTGLQASYSRFGEFWSEDYVSGPITDTLKARLAVTTTQGGAWQQSYTGPHREHGNADKAGARLLTEWQPLEPLKVSLNLNGNYDKSDVQIFQLVEPSPQNAATAAPGLLSYPIPPSNNRAADWDASSPVPLEYDNRFYQAVLRLDLELARAAKVTSISNYAHLSFFEARDPDGTAIPVAFFTNEGSIRTFSQELRLAGTSDDASINYILGANYSSDTVGEKTPETYHAYSTTPPDTTAEQFGNFTSKTWAGFGNVDWEFLPRLTASAGVRFTRVQQAYTSCTRDSGDGTLAGFFGSVANLYRSIAGLPATTAYVPGGCATIGPPASGYLPFLYGTSSTDHNVSWRGSLNYKPMDPLLIYGSVSRGFKAGAYPFENALLASQFTKVRQEEITAYEAGIKLSRSRAFSLNAAAFYYDYVDKQTYDLVSVPVIGLLSVLTNIPKSHAWGFDLDTTLVIARGLTFRSGVTYSRTAIGPYLGYTPDNQLVGEHGRPFPFAPMWSGTADAEYRFPVASHADGFVGAGVLFNSRAYSELSGASSLALRPYTVVDARVGAELAGQWKVTLWGRNLTDRYYWTAANQITDTQVRMTGLPMTFGLTVGYTFR